MNQEFELFFASINQLSEIDKYKIKSKLRQKLYKKYIITLIFCATICYSIYQIEWANWQLCAITRLLMIKMIAIWDWSSIYNEKCLIKNNFSFEDQITYSQNDGKCNVCENYEMLEGRESVNYDDIHHKYVIRGLPFKVFDTYNSSQSSSSRKNMKDVISNILQKSQTCNVETNLMSTKNNLDDIFNVFNAVQNEDESNSYFIHFRNCNFNGVKIARSLIKKPYFYPPQLDPPYSSWIIISEDYDLKDFKDLYLQGLIIVSQLIGNVMINLRAKEECFDICGEFDILLSAGESLVYLSELWAFSYKSLIDEESITFITETNFND